MDHDHDADRIAVSGSGQRGSVPVTVPLTSLVIPPTAAQAESLAQILRAALPEFIMVPDIDASPIRLVRTMRRHMWAWMADPGTPNQWPLLGIAVAIGGFGALPIPITDRWTLDPAKLDRAKALGTAVQRSRAPLAAAMAGAAEQAAAIALRLPVPSATAPSGHEVLRVMLCQVAVFSESDPAVAAVAERLLDEGFIGSPFELIDTARGIAT